MHNQDSEKDKNCGDPQKDDRKGDGNNVKVTIGKQEGPRVACLSVEMHDTEIRDPLAHFMGCLEFCERKEFFETSKPIWKEEHEYQLDMMRHGSASEPPSEAQDEKAQKAVEKLKSTWKKTIKTELRRITFLREKLSQDENDIRLVNAVNHMREHWRSSAEYGANIDQVRGWRIAQGKQISAYPEYQEPAKDDQPVSTSRVKKEAYRIEKDMTVPVIQFQRTTSINASNDQMDDIGSEQFDNQNKDRSDSTNRALAGPVSKCQIDSYDDKRLGGKFPNQKTTIHKLFNQADHEGVLSRRSKSDNDLDLIRYVHIPSNNMIWAEKAIAKYYGDSVPNFNAMHRQLQRPLKTETSMILQERYWRGQLHGDSDSPPHARYMSPMCEILSSSPNKPDYDPKNIVLFMPYLHWELSHRREQFSSEIDKIVISSAHDRTQLEVDKKVARVEQRTALSKPTKQSTSPTPAPTKTHKRNRYQHKVKASQTTAKIETFDDAVEAKRKLLRPFVPCNGDILQDGSNKGVIVWILIFILFAIEIVFLKVLYM